MRNARQYSIIGIMGTGWNFHPYPLRETRIPMPCEVFAHDNHYWMKGIESDLCPDVTEIIHRWQDAQQAAVDETHSAFLEGTR